VGPTYLIKSQQSNNSINQSIYLAQGHLRRGKLNSNEATNEPQLNPNSKGSKTNDSKQLNPIQLNQWNSTGANPDQGTTPTP